jgi:NAD(P)-dependent dehydrogenase (short-subunit alcohol dehydrogenase family)
LCDASYHNRAERAFGRLDILVNNAGIVDSSGVEATTEAL